MKHLNASGLIGRLQKRWALAVMLRDGLTALAATVLIMALLRRLVVVNTLYTAPAVFLGLLFVLAVRRKFWRMAAMDIARYLNLHLPQLEESAQLLLQPAGSLNMLEKMQLKNLEEVAGNSRMPAPPGMNSGRLTGLLALGLMAAFGLERMPAPLRMFHTQSTRRTAVVIKPAHYEKKISGIAAVSVKIIPPAYTGLPGTQQAAFTIRAPAASQAVWQITTSDSVTALSLLFNDRETIPLHPAGHNSWTVGKTLRDAGFYQVNIQGRLSEAYPISLNADQPPAIRILAPRQYRTVDFGEPRTVPVHVSVSDDYGLADASITATIASGSGEAVKFKEQRLPLAGALRGRQRADLQRTLDLVALGMKPGDELYYYVSAHDNHQQENRSDIYIISLPDTAELMEIEGLANSVNLKPDYFRSQRQIILETEQLLKDRDTISTAGFNSKSNNLGIDQHLLRLRYGKFLGEEQENEVGGHHDDHGEQAGHDETVFGDATKIIDEMTHKHDNAEDATFFEPKLKAQLRETLSEMWKAELQLRLYKPQAALPFEYKALRLLKDLQQQSRSYVAKSSYKTITLRPEKRLTADLGKIIEPTERQMSIHTDQEVSALRNAAGLLEELRIAGPVSVADTKLLQAGALSLERMAVSKPLLYLPAYQAMKRLLTALGNGQAVSPRELAATGKGIQQLLADAGRTPRQEGGSPAETLSRRYFSNLQQIKQQP